MAHGDGDWQDDSSSTTILVTGGAGYVGSHTTLLLLEQGFDVVVIDNCSNAHLTGGELDSNGNISEEYPESLRRVEELAGRRLRAFYNCDLVNDGKASIDCPSLDEIFRRHHIKAVIHFAALKSVSESISLPLEYYSNNLIGTINLLNAMRRHSVRRLIFSSSATVYGLPQYNPVDERHQVGLNILNPYGRTKFMTEEILRDLCSREGGSATPPSGNWNIIALRYFNPVGAHPSGYIGEHTQGVPNNLMPYISQVSVGKRDKLYVFGDDFETIDGTGVRDYIHIMDLASGHLRALDHLFKLEQRQAAATNGNVAANGHIQNGISDGKRSGCLKVFNLGTGRGYSVLETIRTFEQVNNVRVPYEIIARREGDAGEVYADASLAKRELGWSARYSLVEMVRDTYNWQCSYPDGFKSARRECAIKRREAKE